MTPAAVPITPPPCPACNGYGRFMFNAPCHDCDSTGTMTYPKYAARLAGDLDAALALLREARKEIVELVNENGCLDLLPKDLLARIDATTGDARA